VNLTDLDTFVLVATAGSMTAAADKLGVPKSTVSRRIRRLEDSLGLSLVTRTPNRVRLTSQGALLRDRCAPALSMIVDAERELHGLASEPTGLLRFTTLVTLAHAPGLTRILLEYQKTYPRVELEVLATDRILDFDQAGIDLALRPVQSGVAGSDGALTERVLGTSHAGLYASPDYLEVHGMPLTLDELPSHLRLAHEPTMREGITLQSPSGKRRRLELGSASMRTTSHSQLLHAALMGATVAVLPTFLAQSEVERGGLVPLFEQWRVLKATLGLVHPAGQTVLPKTRALIELLSEHAVSSGLVCPV
jgi:DNA-binding transcriptional LysR family regulator